MNLNINQTLKDLQSASAAASRTSSSILQMTSAMRESSAQMSTMLNILHIGTHTFVSQLLSGFTSVMSVVHSALGLISQLSSGGGVLGVISGILGFGLNLIGARASGGSVAGNMPYLVGERGPELFTPGTGGYIHSSAKTMQMLSALQSSPVNNFNPNMSIYIGAEGIYSKGRNRALLKAKVRGL